MTDYSLKNKKDGKTFKGAHAESRGTRLVFEERVDLELSVGSWRQSTRSADIYVSSKMTRSRTRVTTIRSSNGKPCADVSNSRQVNGAVRLN